MTVQGFSFKVLENNDLRISIDANDLELADEVRDFREKNCEQGTLLEYTESYWTNGWGVHTADELGQLSECEVIAEESLSEDDGSILVHGRIWYHPNYMIESIIDTILDKGHIDLPLLEVIE